MDRFTYDLSHLDFDHIKTYRDVIELMEEHDKNSFVYSFNTGIFNAAIGKVLNLNETQIHKLFLSGLFHDVGKLGMPYELINFEGAYTIKMYNEMKKHATGSAIILEHINSDVDIVNAARYHHCNFDGTGYPGGLFGKEIPFYARVTRVSDSADAFLSKRCYKEGGPANELFSDLDQYNGTSYDPEIIECFGEIHKKIMKSCHSLGFDRPSQHIYMNQLNELFVPDFDLDYLNLLIK